MRLKTLKLKNIGPFNDVKLDFLDEGQGIPVVIITGENGTGKSIVIDAIRTILKGAGGIERDVIADKKDFLIELTYLDESGNVKNMKTYSFVGAGSNLVVSGSLSTYFTHADHTDHPRWVIDYWSPNSGMDKFEIDQMTAINTHKGLAGALDIVFKNADITNFITNIDYLQGSQDAKEKEIGEKLYALISEMIGDCIGVDKGKFKAVSRINLMPMVEVQGRLVSLDKLSLGNQLLLSHLVRTLYRMYCVCLRNDMPIDKVNELGGVLLIDEIENHLHPQWQKAVVRIIQKYFPNLQLIITTHSPFVVSSVSNPKVLVCKSAVDHAEVVDETDDYSNLPIDEVLCTPVFNASPFNERITQLLHERKEAIRNNEQDKRTEKERELLRLNQTYFTYYKIGEQPVFYDHETH